MQTTRSLSTQAAIDSSIPKVEGSKNIASVKIGLRELRIRDEFKQDK